jgi:hypothetical protein
MAARWAPLVAPWPFDAQTSITRNYKQLHSFCNLANDIGVAGLKHYHNRNQERLRRSGSPSRIGLASDEDMKRQAGRLFVRNVPQFDG